MLMTAPALYVPLAVVEVMDVTVKGLFWLLEEARQSADFRQFILIGGDAALGHFYYERIEPVTDTFVEFVTVFIIGEGVRWASHAGVTTIVITSFGSATATSPT